MARENDAEELRQSLEKILKFSLTIAQRLRIVLEQYSTQMTDECEREVSQRKGTGAEKVAELKSGLTERAGQSF